MKMHAIAAMLVALPGAVLAQTSVVNESNNEAEKNFLEVITVTGARQSKEVSELATSLTVLDTDTITQQTSFSTDLLRALDFRVPGLNVSAGGRGQCLTNIRGRKPSFQINGVPANQELRPSNCNSAFQLSAFAVDQIEVVRGATSLFGAGSPGGIVNIQTKRGRTKDLSMDLVAQSGVNTSSTSGTTQSDVFVGAGQDTGNIDFYVGYGYQNYDAARDPNGNFVQATAFNSHALNSSVGIELSEQFRLRLTNTFYNENPGQEYNADGADVDAGVSFPDVIAVTPHPFRYQGNDKQNTTAFSLEHDSLLGHSLNAAVFYQSQEFRQRANFQDYNAGAPDFFADNRTNSTLGLRTTLSRTFDFNALEWEVQYGADWQRNELLRLLLDNENPAIVTGFIAPEVQLDTQGFFLQNMLTQGDWQFNAGVRRELYSGKIGTAYTGLGLSGEGTPGNFADASLNLWNLGAIYNLSNTAQIFVSFNQGAEITQLGRAARRAKNPELISPEPAVSEQYELGFRGMWGQVEFTASAFYSESDAASLVQPDPSCAGQSFCPLIPLRVPQRVHGLESTVFWQANTALSMGSTLTWQEGEIFNEEFNRYIPFGADTVSPTRLTGYLDWQINNNLSIAPQFSLMAATNFYSTAEQALGYIETPTVFLADLNLSYALPVGKVSLSLSNLLDRRYVNVSTAAGGFIPMFAEGRRATLGYRVTF